MNRLSFPFEKANPLIVAGLVWISSAAALAAAIAGQTAFAQVAMALTLCLVSLLVLRIGRTQSAEARVLSKIASVCRDVARGNLSARITQIAETGDLAEVQSLVNHVIDGNTQSDEARVLSKVASVCKAVARGDFEARITHITETGDLADVQWQVNDVIDRCDAFVREATASLDTVCRGLYYRRILEGGLQGAFRVAAQTINNSVEFQGNAVEQARRESAAQHEHLLAMLAEALKNLAEGNLTFRLHEFPEAYSQVKNDFNTAMNRLEAALQSVHSATDTMATGTNEIAVASRDLAHRAEQQAASLEETSAAMQDLSDTISEAAKSTSQTKNIIIAARADAAFGTDVVRKTVATMEKIRTSSQQINGIIGIIDEIAFQTNLLALNAGVEAARAGDAGRGFAVVATEVRALASRSAEAAKEIKQLISRSSEEVDAGVELTAATREALDRIMQQFSHIEHGIVDIATRALDRVTTMKEVNVALHQIDQITQQNAAMAEQATAACSALANEGDQLAASVARFRVGRPNVTVHNGGQFNFVAA